MVLVLAMERDARHGERLRCRRNGADTDASYDRNRGTSSVVMQAWRARMPL